MEKRVGTIERLRFAEADKSWSSAFADGFVDGQAARSKNQRLRAYVRVGIDDYARGYRQGFFNRTASVHPSRQSPRPLVRL